MFPVEQYFWYWMGEWCDYWDRQRRVLEVLRSSGVASPPARRWEQVPPQQPAPDRRQYAPLSGRRSDFRWLAIHFRLFMPRGAIG